MRQSLKVEVYSWFVHRFSIWILVHLLVVFRVAGAGVKNLFLIKLSFVSDCNNDNKISFGTSRFDISGVVGEIEGDKNMK